MEQRNYPSQTTTNPKAPRNPSWWTDRQSTVWNRVRDAFKRDWEQTVADLSGGPTLNQNAGDTLSQAVGSQSIPPEGVKTHPLDPKDRAREAAKAETENARQQLDAAKAAAKASIESAQRHLDAVKSAARAREEAASATANALKVANKVSDNVADQRARMDDAIAKRDDAVARWQQAELEARYGYSARAQYANANWDDNLEGRLRTEWDSLGTGRSWEESRLGIRRGWDYAGRPH